MAVSVRIVEGGISLKGLKLKYKVIPEQGNVQSVRQRLPTHSESQPIHHYHHTQRNSIKVGSQNTFFMEAVEFYQTQKI